MDSLSGPVDCFLQPKRRMPSDSTTTIAKKTSAILECWNSLISSRPDQYTYSAAISACDGGALFFLRFYSRKISKNRVKEAKVKATRKVTTLLRWDLEVCHGLRLSDGEGRNAVQSLAQFTFERVGIGHFKASRHLRWLLGMAHEFLSPHSSTWRNSCIVQYDRFWAQAQRSDELRTHWLMFASFAMAVAAPGGPVPWTLELFVMYWSEWLRTFIRIALALFESNTSGPEFAVDTATDGSCICIIGSESCSCMPQNKQITQGFNCCKTCTETEETTWNKYMVFSE